MRGSLEAKGHIDALGTLSDDEGDDEDEEEGEDEKEDETSHTEDARDDSAAEKTRVVRHYSRT